MRPFRSFVYSTSSTPNEYIIGGQEFSLLEWFGVLVTDWEVCLRVDNQSP
jgi:hypothetical protein